MPVGKGEAKAAGAPAPVVAPKAADLSPEQEAVELEKRIAVDQARLHRLRNPVVEFPKMVKGRTFASREEQDAAGPDYAEV